MQTYEILSIQFYANEKSHQRNWLNLLLVKKCFRQSTPSRPSVKLSCALRELCGVIIIMDSNFSSEINATTIRATNLFFTNLSFYDIEDEVKMFQSVVTICLFISGAISALCNCLVLLVMFTDKILNESAAILLIIALTAFDLFYGMSFPLTMKMVRSENSNICDE